MFEELVPGTSTITGLVTLMAVAKTMSALKESIKIKQKNQHMNLVFAIFDGEAFDYIGSSATAVDMMSERFPSVVSSKIIPQNITLDSLHSVIELNQLSKTNGSIFIHSDPVSKKESNVRKAYDIFMNYLQQERDYVNQVSVSEVEDLGLPPSSVQSFLRQKKDLLGIHLSNHHKQYEAKFVNSFLDDPTWFSQKEFETNFTTYLTDVAVLVSRTLYRILTDQHAVPSSVKIEPQYDFVSIFIFLLLSASVRFA